MIWRGEEGLNSPDPPPRQTLLQQMEKTLLDMRSNCFYHFSFQLDCMQLLCLQKKVLNLPPKQLSNPHSSRAVTLSKLFNSNRQKQTSPKWRINFYWQSLKKEPYRRRTECIICGLCPLITGVVINIIFVRWRIFDIPPLSSNTQDYHHATIQYSI